MYTGLYLSFCHCCSGNFAKSLSFDRIQTVEICFPSLGRLSSVQVEEVLDTGGTIFTMS